MRRAWPLPGGEATAHAAKLQSALARLQGPAAWPVQLLEEPEENMCVDQIPRCFADAEVVNETIRMCSTELTF